MSTVTENRVDSSIKPFFDEWRDERVARLAWTLDPRLSIEPGTRFVLDQEEGSAKTRGSPLALFRHGWAPVTVLVWLLFILNLTANNLMNAWLPEIVQSSGHSAAEGAYSGSLYQLGGAIGGLCVGILIDRFGLWIMVALFSLAVPIVAFTGTPGLSVPLLLAMAFLSGGAITGMQSALNAGAGLIYPTALRANGVGYALGVGRIGSISGPLIGSLLTRLDAPPATFFYVTALGPLLCAGCFLLLLKDLRATRDGADTVAGE